MTITIKGEYAILNVREWRTLYRVTMLGNIERSERSHEFWLPLLSLSARIHIWKEYTRLNHRFPWRETNDQDITIPGFERYLHPLGPQQMVGWFRCESCGNMYTDTPDLVDRLRSHGCEKPGCANHHPPAIESVLKVCNNCAAEVYDTHGEIDTCPTCKGKL